eukprot:TRINITY_DN706_c0_g1_i1.p1 TRINITY_DN706_c0_g1~~TRINITY_DN706_c0_g1_i1.p1  ORF type:complete len:153 (-),score=26.76 TRINITY_DN706_c0_g1_i1:82-492(-)
MDCTGTPARCSVSHYWKFGAWQYCNATCTGGATTEQGIEYREVFCYGTTLGKNAVNPSNCNQNSRPTNEKACSVTCPKSYTWMTCPWSECSSPCRGLTVGFQERRVFCMVNSGNIVDASFCDMSIKPPIIFIGKVC